MRKFEYYVLYLRLGENAVQILDRYGDAGWEAFHIMQLDENMEIYLKREIP